MVRKWRFFGEFLRPVFSAIRVQQVSDLHPKITLRPNHVWKEVRPMADIQSPTAEIRRGKKERRKKDRRNHRAKI